MHDDYHRMLHRELIAGQDSSPLAAEREQPTGTDRQVWPSGETRPPTPKRSLTNDELRELGRCLRAHRVGASETRREADRQAPAPGQ